MKKPESMPDDLWHYLKLRYSSRTLRSMFSRRYSPNGKQEVARRLRQQLKSQGITIETIANGS